MITLYQGRGSSECLLENPVLSADQWQKLKTIAIGLLHGRGKAEAASILENGGFGLYSGTNGFGDEFCVLHRKVPIDDYLAFGEQSQDSARCQLYGHIAHTLTELDYHIRFIGVDVDQTPGPQPVTTPQPKMTSAVVEMALSDAQQMVSQKQPVSAVDRAHTALHGYLKQLCSDATLSLTSQDPSIMELIKALLKQHPKFQVAAPHQDEAEKIAKGFASILDAINPIRNRGSLAHPNESLLNEAEAMLVINASRTILHYMHHKTDA